MRFISAVGAAVLALPMMGQAQSISTTTPNNGSGGIFVNLTPSGPSLQLDSFATYFSSVAGTPVNVEVWSRPSSYVGNTTSNTGWTLTQTVVAISAGSTVLSAPVALTSPITLSAGGTTAVYLHAVTAGGGIRYTGLAATPPQTTWVNADLTLFSDVARTGAVAFAGTANTPRTFAGTMFYSVPAPGSVALLGLAGLAAARRRRV